MFLEKFKVVVTSLEARLNVLIKVVSQPVWFNRALGALHVVFPTTQNVNCVGTVTANTGTVSGPGNVAMGYYEATCRPLDRTGWALRFRTRLG